LVQREDILEARRKLARHLRPSPVVHSNHLSERFGCKIFLKLENLQDTGSFKVRGALNHLMQLSPKELERGVAAASAGNHAQGLAWAARQLGSPATVFMPDHAPIAKLLATKSYGAEVISTGSSYDDAAKAAQGWVDAHNTLLVPAFDDPYIVAGQGTIGLEILEQVPEVDMVIVPVGGGGLIAGIALAVKDVRPRIQVIGVQVNGAPGAVRSLEAGRRVTAAPQPTLADGIAVSGPGEIPFSIMRRYVDGMFTVEETSVEEAVICLLERKHLLVEGAGAVSLALLQEGRLSQRGQSIVLVISGGNLDIQWLDRIIQRGALAMGRRMRLRVFLPDRPGSLAQVTALIAELGANILQVYHDRLAPEEPVQLSRVDFDLEIKGRDHAETVLQALKDRGIQVVS
jgi:threonine dehydratase